MEIYDIDHTRKKTVLMEWLAQCVNKPLETKRPYFAVSVKVLTLLTLQRSQMCQPLCKNIMWQESIPVGYKSPACQPCIFWWLSLGVSRRHTHPLFLWDTHPRILNPSWYTHPLPLWDTHLIPLWTYQPLDRITDTYENITFPQLLLQVVNILSWQTVFLKFSHLGYLKGFTIEYENSLHRPLTATYET